MSEIIALNSLIASHKEAKKDGKLVAKSTKTFKLPKSNRGVAERNKRDMETERVDKKTWDDIQPHLKRKARKHKELMKGRTGGLSEEQIANLPLDVDSAMRARVSDSDDDSSSEEDGGDLSWDPVVDWTDEDGRERSSRESQVPRESRFDPNDPFIYWEDDTGRPHYTKRSRTPHQYRTAADDEDGVVRGKRAPVTYAASEEKIAAFERAKQEESQHDQPTHWDPRADNRPLGAGHMVFSQDESIRRQQRAAIDEMRAETRANRAQTGAKDVSAIGMQGSSLLGESKAKSSVQARRAAMNEERKAMLAKRRKLDNGSVALPSSSTTTPAPASTPPPPPPVSQPIPRDPMEALEMGGA
ncbi:hypothetical protein CYLTODRAFT_440630 [Cylindrobasidium torrendii FP15055 ss-10]|uniref:Uncharacterized protein n=1 Tax=Cylindrobasidium torrendii FP15055 ss-10 TaxID=1314674 RepID=A0A0D7BQ70_9AGAR|nr:hypothetical protein CYLTODRAFT_440630 [Cylindrobasidium torrendii FP15055 ss-10]